MELTLNLVWVCVAIAGILAQIVMLSRAAVPSDRQGSNWRKIVAMVCVLVILFFVISMTDDLHDQALLLEEPKLSQVEAGPGTRAHSAPARLVHADFLLFHFPEPLSPSMPALRRLMEHPAFLFAAAAESESLCGRAPPLPLA
jgi:hypothetical protein